MKKNLSLFLIPILACCWSLAAADTVPGRNMAGEKSIDKLEQERLLVKQQQEEALLEEEKIRSEQDALARIEAESQEAEAEVLKMEQEALEEELALDMDRLQDFISREDFLSDAEMQEFKALYDRLFPQPASEAPSGDMILVTGDDCTDPIIVDLDVVGLPYSDVNQYTCGRLNDYSTTCLGSYDGGEDIIYQIIVGTAGDYIITMDPQGTTWSGILLDDTCPPGEGTSDCIAKVSNSGSTPRVMTVNLAAGTYYIMVDTWPSPNCIPSFTLTIDNYVAPTGRCCYGDGFCADNTESECTALGGFWDEGLNCTDNPCPVGRCCYSDPVQCADVTQTACDLLGGFWDETQNCTDNPCPSTEGNSCDTPIVVDLDVIGLPYTDAGQTTCGRVDDYNATCLGIYDGGEDIVYQVIVGTADNYLFTLDPLGTTSTGMLLDDTCPPGGTGACIAYVSNSNSNPRNIPIYLEPGTYYVMIDKYSTPTCISSFDLTIDTYSPPANDECVNATPVAVPSSTSGSTVLANPDSAPTCGTTDGSGGAVWYSVTGTGNTMTASTCDEGTNFDTKVRVYCNSCDDLMCAGGDDDDPACAFGTLKSTAIWCSIPGQEYFILVHGFSANSGDFVLNVYDDGTPCADPPPCAPPVGRCCYNEPVLCAENTETECTALGGTWSEGLNCTDDPCPGTEGNDCNNPVVVDLDVVGIPYTDAGQTTCGRLNDYSETCLGSYDGGEDIIYEVIVGTADHYEITLNPLGTTYTGILIDDTCPPGGTGECLAYATASNSSPRVLRLYLDVGTYYIMVDTWPSPTCIPAFDLTIGTYEPPVNDDCTGAIALTGELPIQATGNTALGQNDYGPFSAQPACWQGNWFANSGAAADVVYTWVVPADGDYIISLCGSSFDTALLLYNNVCPPVYPDDFICGNDDSCGLQSELTLTFVGGQEIMIVVDGYSSSTGDYVLEIHSALGACCVNYECVGNMLEDDCLGAGGTWYQDEDCATFQCPLEAVGLATTGNIPDVGVSNYGPLGEYDSQSNTYNWNAQGAVNFAGTFVMGNSSTTMFSYYNAGITDCWSYTATDLLVMDDTFHPTGQYDDSGVLGGLTIDYCGHGFNVDNPPVEASDIFVHVFSVTNNGVAAVDNYYAGIYYDWDIGGTDLITFDRTDNVIIQGPDETYNYGVCLLNAGDVGLTSLAGVSQQDYIYPTTHPPGGWQMTDLYTIISAGTDQIWDAPFTDMSSLVSSGPHTINPGETVTFKFAIIGGMTTADIIADAQYALANLDVPDCAGGSPCGHYVVGDYNGNETFNVADVIAAFSKLQTGSPDAFLLCECPPGGGITWAIAMDVNNNCVFNVADVIAAFSRLQTGSPELVPCELCPPDPSPSPGGGDRPLVVPNLESKAKIINQSGME